MQYDVFISYSRKDAALADKIQCAIEKEGFSCFIDREDISTGADFPLVLSEAIMNSRCFLFLASENAYKSEFTNKEIVFAVNNRGSKCILPVIIDNSVLPKSLEFLLGDINWQRLSPFFRIEPDLVNDVKQLLLKIDSADDTVGYNRSDNPKKKKRLPLLLGIIIALLIVCFSFGGYSYFDKQRSHNIDLYYSTIQQAKEYLRQDDSIRLYNSGEQTYDKELFLLNRAEMSLHKADSIRSIINQLPLYEDMPDLAVSIKQEFSFLKSAMFLAWKQYAINNWMLFLQSRDTLDKEIAERIIDQALVISPDNDELLNIREQLQLL